MLLASTTVEIHLLNGHPSHIHQKHTHAHASAHVFHIKFVINKVNRTEREKAHLMYEVSFETCKNQDETKNSAEASCSVKWTKNVFQT